MPGCVFLLRPNVEQHDFVVPHAAHEFLARDVLQPVRPAHSVVDELTDLLAPMVRKASQGRQHVFDWPICQTIEHAFPVSPGLHQAGPLEVLKMLRGVGQRDPGKLRQLFYRQFAVGNVAEENQPVCMSQRSGEIGYFVKDRMMDVCVFHTAWLPSIKRSINTLNEMF
ncbi:hypothetical protein BQ8482_180454 [Mesorhizobium delmotii]|uniref:Uncharacterized protein n=1 Tax=Mesorhizobium delmotii TaxID=1631247 RepID=A0A2P9AJB8_9HYPH|nr:hypothetical protein BQ8482_180454 [Mesorhizobium delmotii]